MAGDSLSQSKAQLDKEERERLEDVVADMRERCENNVRFQLRQKNLDDEPEDIDALDDDSLQLVEAIELESIDAWDEAFEQYVTGVGYTIVNRLAALRCMEVRDFVDEEVTVFKENGLPPAAETLVYEEFLLEEEAILSAYQNTCEKLAEEIEILFDPSSAYSLVDPDDDAFEDLCTLLDQVPDEVWRADDVLGWVYEYYNRPVVEALDAKNTLEPEDVGPANQFYTPHWVVRMLTDNSLGKLYLEATDQQSALSAVDDLSIEERKERPVTPEAAPDIPNLCTYLIPDEGEQDPPSFDYPSEIRVIDPACGSGHFLLYAFDILERIWWTERPDLDRSEIPAQILEHNLYGVDIDLRSCQLAAFNLYLKARTRVEEEGDDRFEMPNVGIVCADAQVAEVEEAVDVLDEITAEGTKVREALEEIVEEFQTTEALGSLLDVQETLSKEFVEADAAEWSGDGPHTLNAFLKRLREAVEARTSDSFGAQNLRSFLNLLVVLTQDYDVALMNPPYGARGRMPNAVRDYVKNHYDYTTEYYINFFEVCNKITKENGRVGMIVQRSFMYKTSFQNFREDFIGKLGTFDFIAEYGNGVLDNATVRTAGTVVRTGTEANEDAEGMFYRLHDLDAHEKEAGFLDAAFDSLPEFGSMREYRTELSEFSVIPGTPLSYWVPPELRSLYESEIVFDADNANLNRSSLGGVKQGIATADDTRFVRKFWENNSSYWVPFAKGGEDAWVLPKVNLTLDWEDGGKEVKRYTGSYPRNTDYYFHEALTYTYMKSSGRRFGYLHSSSIFGHAGNVFVPNHDIWRALSYSNSHLLTFLVLCQTPERHWEVSTVSKLPWRPELEEIDELESLPKAAVGHLISKRQYDFVSPHYSGPILLAAVGIEDPLPQYDHPHRELRQKLELDTPTETLSPDTSLSEIGVAAAKHLERIEANLQTCADAIDEAVFDCFDITDDQRETILQEIALRTNEDPREREEHDPDTITGPTDDFPEMVKDLLLHLAIRVIHEDDDGVVPLSHVENEDDLLTRIEREFERLFDEHASERLVEADQILGSQTADQETYPNLRAWLANELFEYHVSKFDRTPILWRLTTERLVSDPEGEGFACLVAYHQLDTNIFDRLQNRYLEPRKALLRERRSAANRRQGDDLLSTSEQVAAVEEYERCESGLEQIQVFEDKLGDLAQSSPREWSEEKQQTARKSAEKVTDFREETASRLETLEELAALENVEMSDLFSPSFYETVKENQDEWLDALDDLETAFEAYAQDGSEPVEAHLYDLFEYYDDLVGSSHYASNGILFMTYYFEGFESSDQMKLGDSGGGSNRQRLLGELARDLESYKKLADEIGESCDDIASDIPSEWTDRALSEITTAGYRPNHKHGVVVNITPLADAEIVPKIVDRVI